MRGEKQARTAENLHLILLNFARPEGSIDTKISSKFKVTNIEKTSQEILKQPAGPASATRTATPYYLLLIAIRTEGMLTARSLRCAVCFGSFLSFCAVLLCPNNQRQL